jgi:hypothetical protein
MAHRTALLLVIIFAALPDAAWAAISRARSTFQEMNFTLEGKVTEHTAGKLTVSTDQNIIFHVSYDEKTVIEQDGGKGSTEDLRVGVQIKVDGELTESGEIKAHKILIEKASKSSAAFSGLFPAAFAVYSSPQTASLLPRPSASACL